MKVKQPVPQAEPCGHEDAWVPTAVIFGGTKAARADVYCWDCGRTFRVPVSKIPRWDEEADR